MIDPKQFRDLVIRPALVELGLHSYDAEILLLRTALVESGLVYLHQIGGGPARGPFQIEPATHDDIFENYLSFRPKFHGLVMGLAAPLPRLVDQLASNLIYSAAICRLVYFRIPAPLPAAEDLDGQAEYWKRHYNTPAGAGTVQKFKRAAGKVG